MISNLFSRSFKNTKLNVRTKTGDILPKNEVIAGLGMVWIALKKKVVATSSIDPNKRSSKNCLRLNSFISANDLFFNPKRINQIKPKPNQ